MTGVLTNPSIEKHLFNEMIEYNKKNTAGEPQIFEVMTTVTQKPKNNTT